MNLINKRYLSVLILITITVFTLWEYGKANNFIPCVSNCGETFCAEIQVNNFKLYGFKYGLLEDHANSNNLQAHPYLYTHNVSTPSILYPLLEWAGISALWTKQLFSLFIFGLSLFYIYRTTLFYSQSYLIAGSMLFFFCTDYYHVFSYGLNALRVWHWLVLFGLLFHVGRYFKEPTKSPWTDRLMIPLYVILAFGVGYDFWIINLFVILTLTIFSFFSVDYKKEKILIHLFSIGLIFAFPVILRQIHIISTLGYDFWYHDFIYSASIKIPFLKDLFPLTSMTEIDEYYTAHNVLRAPATQAAQWAGIFVTLKDMLRQVTIPSFGTLNIGFVILVLFFPIINCVYVITSYLMKYFAKMSRISTAARFTSFFNVFEFSKGGLKLFFIITIGCSIGVLIFAPFSLHVYFKHQFPLLAAPILLAKSIVLSILIVFYSKLLLVRSNLRWLPLSLITFIILDHFIIQLDNIKYFKPIPTSWVSAVKKYKDSSFATSWIPDSVAAFTDSWVVAINAGAENKIIKRFQENKAPFKYSDYFLFGQQDVNIKTNKYLYPKYWLYYSTDQANQFDTPSPICYQDYLAKFIGGFSNTKPIIASMSDLGSIHTFSPGSDIAIVGTFANPSKANINRIEFVSNGQVLSKANYNCIYGSFNIIYTIPENYSLKTLPINVVVTYNGNRKVVLEQITFQNTPGSGLKNSDINPAYLRRNQLSVEETITALPNVPIAERGKDYVIFDLDKYYKQHRIM
ncbi:MAG: hypothetical protein P1U74_01775 [Legionellaceae bacterium]|nr:hypothetical protein [Legionellaceae bacterium]